MKKGILTSLGLAAVLTLGLATVNEVRSNVVDAAEATKTINLGGTDTGFSSWNSSYVARTITATTFEEGDTTISFSSANKQTGTITDCPVSKKSDNSITLNGNAYFTSITFTFKQWTNKVPKFTIGYDGGTETKTTTFQNTVTINIPEEDKVSSVYFNQTSTNQVGYASISYTAVLSETPVVKSPDELVQELVNGYVAEGVYTKATSINIDTESDDLKADLGTMFHGKMTVEGLQKNLNKTTYYNGNELWMTNDAKTINSGYGTVTALNQKAVSTDTKKEAIVGHMTHFQYLNNQQVYDYTVAVEGGMEAYYVTPKDFAREENEEPYFNGWTYNESSKQYELNVTAASLPQNSDERTVLSDFIDVVAPLLYWEDSDNYFTYKKLVVKEDAEKEQLILQIVLDDTNAEGVLKSGNVLAQAVITKGNDEDFSYKAPALDKATFSFDDQTGNGTKLDNTTALPFFANDLGEYAYALKSVDVTNVYDGNGSGGQWANQAGFLKFGTSSANGKLILTFDNNTKFTTVKIKAHAWTTSSSDTISVNGESAQNLSKTGTATELTFTISESNVIEIVVSKRGFIFEITLD